jgi:hypothetical protein
LFQDWKESSAGQGGRRFCDHWWLEFSECRNELGVTNFSLIPQWADADGGLGLPQIDPDWDESPYVVMDSLKRFDELCGYEFGWFLYMLHGNRIAKSAGGIVANALRAGLLRLPDCDIDVLMRWRESQYGF